MSEHTKQLLERLKQDLKQIEKSKTDAEVAEKLLSFKTLVAIEQQCIEQW